jgi:hypothetical protein
MSAGAPAEPGESGLDLYGMDVEEVRARSRIMIYADEGEGVHAVRTDRGIELFARCQAAASPTDESTPLVWIDVAAPGDDEARFLRDTLHFHPLAVEDTVRGRQRPKLDRYPGYFFLVFYSAAINAERGRMALHEVHVFIGRRFIVTVHDHDISPLSEVLVRWRANEAGFRNVGALATPSWTPSSTATFPCSTTSRTGWTRWRAASTPTPTRGRSRRWRRCWGCAASSPPCAACSAPGARCWGRW